MQNKHIFWCSKCLNTSTRPRIFFDENGVCNACQWSEEKKKLNWKSREKEFKKFLKSKKNNSQFDIIVPVSGGKDGSYVTHVCKERYNLKVLNVTINPPLRSEIGYKNLENFKKNNLNLIEINLPHKPHMILNKFGFVNNGRPLYGWLISIFTSIIRIAQNFNIDTIMYGEDGEAEYGGSSNLKNKAFFDISFVEKVYLSNEYRNALKKITEEEKYWFLLEKNSNLQMSHWSYFEKWDSYRNFVVAKKHMGLQENDAKNVGTYTNFAQNDTVLYNLHVYMMFLKFGFGRANQDAGIDIRRGSLTRNQALQLANIYDYEFPENDLEKYLDYFEMNKQSFYRVIDKHVNKKLFKKKKGKWIPSFKISS